MNIKPTFPVGGMYQKWMSLIDLVEENTVPKLNEIAVKYGWREVQPKEAMDMGFEELVNWSKPETDILVLVGDDFLVCLNNSDFSIN
jgi:hypothetical protein